MNLFEKGKKERHEGRIQCTALYKLILEVCMENKATITGLISFLFLLTLFFTSSALAHCDSMSGPVILAAQKALDTGKVDQVLVWVQKKDEGEIRKAFKEALNVRKLGPQAKDLADRYFFETLVRIHRAGEGAPYTGIKPAGTDPGPAVEGADKAIETGKVDSLVKMINDEVAKGIRQRFEHAMELKEHASHNVEAGRAYVGAYVTFFHYVEGIYDKAATEGGHHEEGSEAKAPANKHEH